MDMPRAELDRLAAVVAEQIQARHFGT